MKEYFENDINFNEIYKVTPNGLFSNVINSICKIIYKNTTGTGFFIQLEKDKMPFFCLISCEHVITKKMIDSESKIKVYYQNEDKIIYIKLNSNERFIQDFSYLNIDATIVEILPKDNISKEYFLLPNLNPTNQLELLLNKKVYILHYPKGGKLCYSYGIIKSIDEYSYIFSYLGGTKSGSSGGPIFVENTSLVIGIHKQRNKNNEEKYGDFISRIATSLTNKFVYLNGIYDHQKNVELIKLHNNVNLKINDLMEKFNQSWFITNEKLEIVKLEIEINLENNEAEGTITYSNGYYYKGHIRNNTLRHGKGIYYNKDKAYIYKGNFAFNEYDGYGIFRDLSENVVYDGHFKNGLMHGKGKLSIKIGIEYEGDFFCGLMEGKGVYYEWDSNKVTFYNGQYNQKKVKLYEGELKNNRFDGLGTFYYEDGRYYIGQFKNGNRHGKGQLFYKDKSLEYEGDFIDNLFEGNGKYFFQNGECFIGKLKKGKKEGKGILYYKSKNEKYIGYFVNDKPEGKGIFLFDEKEKRILYEGDFMKGRYEGIGQYNYPNGEYYIGQFKNNLRNGNGILLYKNHNIKYEGEFYNNVPEGIGKRYLENGLIYEGQFKNGDLNGQGKAYVENGILFYEGEFVDNKFEGEGKIFLPSGKIIKSKFKNNNFIDK